TQVSCDDGIACTDDACDAGTGTCTHAPNDTFCTGGQICHPQQGCVCAITCTAPKVLNATACACECPECNPGQAVTNPDSCTCTCGPDQTFCRPGERGQGSPEQCFTCPETFVPSVTQTCVCECPSGVSSVRCVTSEGQLLNPSRCCGSSQICIGTPSDN